MHNYYVIMQLYAHTQHEEHPRLLIPELCRWDLEVLDKFPLLQNLNACNPTVDLMLSAPPFLYRLFYSLGWVTGTGGGITIKLGWVLTNLTSSTWCKYCGFQCTVVVGRLLYRLKIKDTWYNPQCNSTFYILPSEMRYTLHHQLYKKSE